MSQLPRLRRGEWRRGAESWAPGRALWGRAAPAAWHLSVEPQDGAALGTVLWLRPCTRDMPGQLLLWAAARAPLGGAQVTRPHIWRRVQEPPRTGVMRLHGHRDLGGSGEHVKTRPGPDCAPSPIVTHVAAWPSVCQSLSCSTAALRPPVGNEDTHPGARPAGQAAARGPETQAPAFSVAGSPGTG